MLIASTKTGIKTRGSKAFTKNGTQGMFWFEIYY